LLALAIVAVAACACGDKQPRAQSPRGADNGRASQSQADAGTAPSTGDPAGGPADTLTEEECRGLVDHVVAIAEERFRADAVEQGKPIPTEAQLQKIRESLGKELGAACRRMRRQDYECAMRAQDATAYEACARAEPPVDN
jgi:hypothetical protein